MNRAVGKSIHHPIKIGWLGDLNAVATRTSADRDDDANPLTMVFADWPMQPTGFAHTGEIQNTLATARPYGMASLDVSRDMINKFNPLKGLSIPHRWKLHRQAARMCKSSSLSYLGGRPCTLLLKIEISHD